MKGRRPRPTNNSRQLSVIRELDNRHFGYPAGVLSDTDFRVQGEYAGELRGQRLGCQVIALGGGAFQAVLLPGGLPGDGWDGQTKILMDGRLEEGRTTFRPTAGQRKYLAQSPLLRTSRSARWNGTVPKCHRRSA